MDESFHKATIRCDDGQLTSIVRQCAKPKEARHRLFHAEATREIAFDRLRKFLVTGVRHGHRLDPRSMKRQHDDARRSDEAAAPQSMQNALNRPLGMTWLMGHARRRQDVHAAIASDLHHANKSIAELNPNRSRTRPHGPAIGLSKLRCKPLRIAHADAPESALVGVATLDALRRTKATTSVTLWKIGSRTISIRSN
jgi:hypothetical protein